MKRFFLAMTIAAGMLAFATPGAAQFVQGSGQASGTNAGAQMKGKRYGPNDGTGNQGQRPQDGTGYGAKAGNKSGTGICDGTGPKGQTSRGQRAAGTRGGRR